MQIKLESWSFWPSHWLSSAADNVIALFPAQNPFFPMCILCCSLDVLLMPFMLVFRVLFRMFSYNKSSISQVKSECDADMEVDKCSAETAISVGE